ncbi:MAG TPA: primosomal protein N' [Frankiaceae bacterium]|nr:primosomal protein N' [Frankiaceae bacterium]
MENPVARIAVDVPLAHLDRPFDYAVPEALDEAVVPGSKVRVRFAGRLVDGWVLSREAASDLDRLSPVAKSVSAEPVLSPEVAGLCRAVADRWAGSFVDVVRLAVPPRHARVEKEPPRDPPPLPEPPDTTAWGAYESGEAFIRALASGGAPRAVWETLPGGDWPRLVAVAAAATVAAGRGAVVVVPDARDLARVCAALDGLAPYAALTADLGPAERYRRWLAVRRGVARCVVGTRAAAWAPVRDLGLAVCWDDGDDLHKEPRAPYPHVRDVLALRAHREGAGLLVGGHAPSAEAVRLVETGWARPLRASRATVRRAAPRTVVAGGDVELERDAAAASARLPTIAWRAAREALDAGAPVLLQVPRAGYQPGLACARCRTPARCAACQGPLGRDGPTPGCRWCGRPAADWRCPACDGDTLRAVVTGSRRTAEELGRAFAGVPVRTSDREHVHATVEGRPQLVVATPGAEPVADGGYGAVLLLDGWALLSRADLRAGEEALRRWANAAALARPAHEGGRVVVMADAAIPAVQALLRWDAGWYARRELADRAGLAFPPAVRMAAVDGTPAAVAEVLALLPEGLDVLGPVPYGDGERALVRVPNEHGNDLAAALKAALAQRSARKAPDPARVELDPLTLI